MKCPHCGMDMNESKEPKAQEKKAMKKFKSPMKEEAMEDPIMTEAKKFAPYKGKKK